MLQPILVIWVIQEQKLTALILLLHVTVTLIIAWSVASNAKQKMIFFLPGAGSEQKWHRANESSEIRKSRRYGKLDVSEWS